ncbi:MAG: gliding motility-associated C-terminal domain-containing protein [Bacteroidota bacterium]
MRKIAYIFCLSFLLPSLSTNAQTFQLTDSLNLPNLTEPTILWADFDNNSYQDAMLIGIDSLGKPLSYFLKNNNNSTALVNTNLPNILNSSFSIADFNHDTFLDIFVTGNDNTNTFIAQIWQNDGDFNFSKVDATFNNWQSGIGKWVDFDLNGDYDLVLSGVREDGNNTIAFYKNTDGSFEEITTNIEGLADATIGLLDVNKDIYTDLIISGKASDNTWKTLLIINKENFKYEVNEIETAFGGKQISIGDINHDGNPEFGLSGTDADGVFQTNLYLNQGEGNFALYQQLNNYLSEALLIADLDKDGFADIYFSGKDAQDQTQTVIYQYNTLGNYQILDTLLPQIPYSSLGDIDNDGDLDVLLMEANNIASGLYLNHFPDTNYMPPAPTDPFAIAIHGKTIFSWIPPEDDLTPQSALTYDVFVGRNEFGVDLVSPFFNTENGIRKMPQHGIAGHASFFTLNELLSGRIFWGVHPVDNSLANATNNSICFGNVLYDCVDIELKDTLLCQGNTLELVNPIENSQAIWFSVNQGYLGTSDKLQIDLATDDTIFYVVPNDFSCTLAVSWSVKVAPERDEISLGDDTIVCKNEMLNYTIPEDGWAQVEWTSAMQGALGNGNTIAFEVLENDILKVVAQDEAGCILSDSVVIDTYDLKAKAGEDVIIKEGESAQLEAFDAISYEWSPDNNIDNINSPTPIVDPLVTTTYIVIMQDSSGCEVLDSVLVTVEKEIVTGTLFIPNLFTPNSDGNNDAFKLYGLQNVNNISFHIFDSQGNTVYKSEDINTLQQVGWDGSKSGRVLKNGTYFWRLEGKYENGEPILFSGKQEGFLTLLR